MRINLSRIVAVALSSACMLSVAAYGQTVIAPAQVYIQPAPWAWPYGPNVMPYWGYWYSPCYPFASCMAYQQFQILERRQERWDDLRRGQQAQPTSPIPIAAAAAPLNDTDVKAEYKSSGQYLPEFLDGRVRPGH